MSHFLSAKDVVVDFPSKRALNNVTLGVDSGDRIGIVGHNGSGKSTLIKVLSGQSKPHSGEVTRRNNLTIGVLSQIDNLNENLSVKENVVGDVPNYVWASNPETREIINHLLIDIDWEGSVATLSGGQRRRVDLARVLLGDYDVLMLDEPTNHLDISAITWLAKHLNSRWASNEGALLVITHDRWFLDEVALSMWEVYEGNVEEFEGGYSAYVQRRAERDEARRVAEQKRQNLMRRELAWLSRGARARTSKPKFNVNKALDLIAQDPPLRDERKLRQLAMSRLGKQVFSIGDLTISAGDTLIIKDLSWHVGPGDRIAILGANGSGKSTFLKTLAGVHKPDSGKIKTGSTVKIGVLPQRLTELDKKSKLTVYELLEDYKKYFIVGDEEKSSVQILEELGFSDRHLKTRIEELSGGQKRILQFALMLFEEPNVLLLDEPGNDLDTDMLASVESLLDSWAGTLLVVSHDRYLVERVTEDQYAIIGNTLKHFPGGVNDYLEYVKEHDLNTVSVADSVVEENKTAQKSGVQKGKKHYQLKKELDSLERKILKQRNLVQSLKDEFEEINQTDYEKLEDKLNQIQGEQDTLDQLELNWLEISEELDV